MSAAAIENATAMLPSPALVTGVEKETHDTFTLTLAPQNGARTFAPGQFSMLYVFGVGELPISISGDPADQDKLTFTVRSVGKATHALVTREPGDAIGVRGPFGTAWPLAEARGRDVLIVAGGIGLAPLRPAIYSILRHRGDYGRVVVLYGARNPKDLLFRKQLSAWNYVPDTQVMTTVDYGGLSWRGNVGVVTTLFRHLRPQPRHTVAMVCGPEIMMRYVARELRARGFGEDDVYLSMERNMRCAIGLCGHCQIGPFFVCKDGPIFRFSRMKTWMDRYEL